ncbi:hypothetical protein BC830DRAFT_1083199 [Chytriomyces sp. MP71]|nr:hypothetical protein BC830DRAFT_1083199 [Chytriomyces sp. MP71]
MYYINTDSSDDLTLELPALHLKIPDQSPNYKRKFAFQPKRTNIPKPSDARLLDSLRNTQIRVGHPNFDESQQRTGGAPARATMDTDSPCYRHGDRGINFNREVLTAHADHPRRRQPNTSMTQTVLLAQHGMRLLLGWSVPASPVAPVSPLIS